ncbi:MAG: DUF2851 family protein [Verrucomicrobiia bacterium]|jgi:hypothetical protein
MSPAAAGANAYEKIVADVYPHIVCDEPGESPPEKLMQAIWFNQRIRRGKLKTIQGEKLKVLHPGFFNVEAGPDFKNAIIQFGNGKPVQGDVEIDSRVSDWKSHSHHSNPAYKNVILQVVWGCSEDSTNSMPVMQLKRFLEHPLAILEDTVGIDLVEQFPASLEGVCSKIFKNFSAERRKKFLEEAALFRLEQKSLQIIARARDSSFEQALWELLFRALGYKNNIWAFQCLGELRPAIIDHNSGDLLQLEARLFGLSGLLPFELPRVDSENDSYIKTLWDYWWREQEAFVEFALPASIWRLSGTRPANHPHRRLALAARWLFKNSLHNDLINWLKTADTNSMEESFLNLLTPQQDPFWNWHYSVKSKKTSAPQPLIGADRATDIAINVALPWLLAVSRENFDKPMEDRVVEFYLKWGPAQDNALLKLARKRLFGSLCSEIADSAATQQGIIQVVKNFCENSDSVCTGCRFPAKLEQYYYS